MVNEISPRMLQSEPMQRCCLNECRAACCLHGVWIDRLEVERIRAAHEKISAHLPPARQDPDLWFDDQVDDDEFTPSGVVLHSRVLEDADHYGGTSCIFLRPDSKCALQVAADAEGLHPWAYKPFYCVLHPLDLDEQGRITVDQTDLLLEEQASCLRLAPQPVPLVETFAPELLYLLGQEKYGQVCRLANGEQDQ